MLPFQNTRMGPVMVKEGILESLGCPNEYSRTPKSKEAPTCLLNTQCVPRTALGSLYTYCQLKFCEGGGISSMFSMCKLRVRESRGHLAALAQADGWQPLGARTLTPLPFQVMATPRRAVPSSTAPTQRRERSTMARTWPCLRWVARGVGPPHPSPHSPGPPFLSREEYPPSPPSSSQVRLLSWASPVSFSFPLSLPPSLSILPFSFPVLLSVLPPSSSHPNLNCLLLCPYISPPPTV